MPSKKRLRPQAKQWLIRWACVILLLGLVFWGYTKMREGTLQGRGVPGTVSAAERAQLLFAARAEFARRVGQDKQGKDPAAAKATPKAAASASQLASPEAGGTLPNRQGQKEVQGERPGESKTQVERPVPAGKTLAIGERRDSTGSIPVALRDMPLEDWKAVEAKFAPIAKRKLEKGVQQDAQQGRAGVFGAVDVAIPLKPPILQYPLNTGGGQAQKNIVGFKALSKSVTAGRKCIVYGMGIAEESFFEEMMAQSGCETHAFDCTVDYEAPAVYKKKFHFHQWCIGSKPAASQSSGDNTYSSSATVRLEGKLPCDDNCNITAKVVSGGKGGGGNRADFYLQGKKIPFQVGRGMNVVSLDPKTQKVLTKVTYDTFAENMVREGARMAKDVEDMPEGQIVLMAVMDTGIENLGAKARAAMRALGAKNYMGGFRESYAFIGRKGHAKVAESRSRDVPSKLVFKTLAQTMTELGHKYLDLLKFDIEGFEWKLFESEILTKDREHMPEQISFELHTQAANPAYVPQDVVRGHGYKQVNKLMLDLFEAGYRITSKEVNNGDPACAEFVALNVQ